MAPDFLALVPWALATRSGGFDGRAGLGLFIIGRELSPNLCMQTGATNFRSSLLCSYLRSAEEEIEMTYHAPNNNFGNIVKIKSRYIRFLLNFER